MIATHLRTATWSAVLVLGSLIGGSARAAETAEADAEATPPGLQALETFRNPPTRQDPVRNRFFYKGKRFEISPQAGVVPNNEFARRISAGVGLGYHFNENLSVQGLFTYAADTQEGDVKALTAELIRLANDPDFRQPLDKVTLSAMFGVQFAPFYGKINLVGEKVVNFDAYGFAGLGFVLQNEYYAGENPNFDAASRDRSQRYPFELEKTGSELRAAPALGLGVNFFLTRAIALKLDGRFLLVVDDKLQYDLDNIDPGLRVVPLFTASAGIGVFVGKTKPRSYDY